MTAETVSRRWSGAWGAPIEHGPVDVDVLIPTVGRVAELAVTLEDLLDRHATDGPEVRRAYRRAMALELGFFDGAMLGP